MDIFLKDPGLHFVCCKVVIVFIATAVWQTTSPTSGRQSSILRDDGNRNLLSKIGQVTLIMRRKAELHSRGVIPSLVELACLRKGILLAFPDQKWVVFFNENLLKILERNSEASLTIYFSLLTKF